MILFTILALITVDVFLLFCLGAVSHGLSVKSQELEVTKKRAKLAEDKSARLERELGRLNKQVDAEWPSEING